MSSCQKICEDFASLARYRLAIQSPSEASDDYGGFDVTWATDSTVWGYIRHASSREVYQSEMLQSKVTHKIYIRYQSALKDTATAAKNRIGFDSRIFQIVSVKNIDKTGKYEGTVYQEIEVVENEAGNV